MRGLESMVIGDTAQTFSLSVLQELLHDWETCCRRKPWECFQLFSGYVLSCDYWHVWKKLAGHCTMTTKKKVRTYGASAEKLRVADNISNKKNKKPAITVETWRRREAQGGQGAICNPTSCDTSNLPPGGPLWTSQLPRCSSHQACSPKG